MSGPPLAGAPLAEAARLPGAGWGGTLAGLAALAGAVGAALLAGLVHQAAPAGEERAVALVGVSYAALAAAALGLFALVRRRTLTASGLGLAALLVAAVLLVGSYLYWASSALFYRADILIWSESPFVNDILKLRLGRPLYGSPADLDSFFYTPGSQLLTYLLAGAAGHSASIPAYRVIQLLYAAGAALLAARCVLRVRQLSAAHSGQEDRLVVPALWAAVLFLCATNASTNPFAFLLHNDGLSVLVSAAAYLLLLEYAATRRRWLIVAMAAVPAAGFLVKQSLGIWAPLYGLYLLAFDGPRPLRRVLGFGALSAALLGTAYGSGRLLWGADFHYWVFQGMGNHSVSPLRALQHVLDAWAYFAAGLAGGIVIGTTRTSSRLLGAWLVWLLLMLAEAYTSGIAWMLNHMGPGSLVAGVWLCAALTALWPGGDRTEARSPLAWLRAAAAVAIAVLLGSGLSLVRLPERALPADAQRYAAAIEGEFAGLPPQSVLLDAGTWVYLGPGVVMRDRSAAVGELGISEVGDFSGILERLRGRYYARVLARSINSDQFPYDHGIWRRSSGIRRALLDNYRVVRVIPGVEGRWTLPRHLEPVSVLEPRRDSTRAR